MYVYFHILYNLALECDLTLWSVMMQSVNRRCERVSNSPPVSRQYRAGTLNSKLNCKGSWCIFAVRMATNLGQSRIPVPDQI